MLTVDESANGQSVALRIGESLEVRLPENRTTGFRWAVLSGSDGSCALSEERFEPPSSGPGEPGVHCWRFRAERAGHAHIELASRRPWEDSETAARRFTLRVDVSA